MTDASKPWADGKARRLTIARDQLHRASALLTLVLLIIGFAMASPAFLSVNNGLTVLLQTSVIGLLGIGLTMVIITGRSRMIEAFSIASRTGWPRSRN